jgi:hypothetical protein
MESEKPEENRRGKWVATGARPPRIHMCAYSSSPRPTQPARCSVLYASHSGIRQKGSSRLRAPGTPNELAATDRHCVFRWLQNNCQAATKMPNDSNQMPSGDPWQTLFTSEEHSGHESGTGSLGVNFVRASKPEYSVDLPHSGRTLYLKQELQRGLGAVVWACVS